MVNTLIPQPDVRPASEASYRHQLRWYLFLRIVIVSILLGTTFLLQTTDKGIITPPAQYINYFIAGVYLFTIGSVLLLKKTTNFKLFALIQIIIDTALIALLVFFSGGSKSIFVTIYFFPIVAASFILLRKGGLAVAALSTFSYGAILVLEFLGYHPEFFYNFWYQPLDDIKVVLNYFSIHGLVFFMVAILSTMLSERLRKTEKALSQTTLRFDQLSVLYKQIFDDINTGIITIDKENRITSFNRASETITGYTPKEILGLNLKDKFADLNIGDENYQPSTMLTRKNGDKIPVGISSARLNFPGDSGEYEVITLQNLSEIKKMEEQVHQAEKMAAIGEMAASVAHEFRNPLAAISGSAQIMSLDLKGDPDTFRLMEIILRESSRLESSISGFLQFSKPAVPEKEWFSLSLLVDDIIQLLKQTPDWTEEIEFKINLSQKIDYWGDAQQIKQILINLIHNCCVALKKEGGNISVSTEEITEDDGSEKNVIIISDNGPGITTDIIDKVFNPFFTTREKGTGLGLAIVQQIIKGHEGEITLESEPGEGTTFRVSLPSPYI